MAGSNARSSLQLSCVVRQQASLSVACGVSLHINPNPKPKCLVLHETFSSTRICFPAHYRPSNIVTDTWFVESSCLLADESVSDGSLATIKPGCLGCGRRALSPPSITTTADIVGRSSGRS
ncbi:hypothetical protein GW17_00033513 [Ensete ventricosum]|nr:hypothetical protein GW17_00033513 [Ensete ventricosum]